MPNSADQILGSNLLTLPLGVSQHQTEQPVRNSSIIIPGRNAFCKSALSCRPLCLNPYSLSPAPLVYFCGVSVQQTDSELNLGATYRHNAFPKLT